MAQMSWIRQKLGGYRLVDIKNYNDVSYMTAEERAMIPGVPISRWSYINNRGRTVQKKVSGHWGMNKIKHND